MHLKKNEKPIWITWENQRRNREVAKRIGATLYEWDHIDGIKNRARKYIYGLLKTTRLLIKVRPRLVFCQNPSIILSFFLCIIGKFFPIVSIVDAHNGGLYPLGGRSVALNRISIFIQRHAFLTIVSNHMLKESVEKNGGNAFVLPDPIPALHDMPTYSLEQPFNILFICSFESDEPYENVFSAATKIDSNWRIYVTGNFKKRNIDLSKMPENISFLGYISEHEYIKMLRSVDAVIDLTDRDNCLVCGAYESVAAEKPMIISDTKALRHFFYKGAIYTDNTVDSIALSIEKAQKEHYRLVKEIRQLKFAKQIEWTVFKNNLMAIISKEKKVY